jgi:hypothetical protein
MHKVRLSVFVTLLLALTVAGQLLAGGNRERVDNGAEVRSVPVVGEVRDVTVAAGSDTVLTIATDEGPEVEAAVPARMAETLRIAPGDRFVSEERVLENETERLRVLEFSIERRR